ncbi:MAG: glycosyltransferase [Calditrichales bacterium]|nr:glycosyltransferase [Calditrichales bacterium]
MRWNKTYYDKVYRILKKEIGKNNISSVISRNTTFLPYLAKIKEKFMIPTFFETHDFYADLSIRSDLSQKKKNRKRKYEKIERKYIPQISGVICLQNAQKKLYQKIFKKQNIYVARTGITKLHHSSENRYFLTYIGSLDPHKGVKYLINALSYSKSKPHLLIIGGKNNREKELIKKEAQNHYDLKKITITGWINKKEMDLYLKQTAVGIIPLCNTFFNKYLTSPLKLFDFYSYGIPVIVSDLPTHRELVEENMTGLFFEPDNPRELVDKIDTLFADQQMQTEMSNRIYTTTEKYLWKNRAKQIVEIIEGHLND